MRASMGNADDVWVVGFRGSFLDLLFKLEPYGSGLDKQPLLIHMPGFTEQSIRATPVLERPSRDAWIDESSRKGHEPANLPPVGQRLSQHRVALADSTREPAFGPRCRTVHDRMLGDVKQPTTYGLLAGSPAQDQIVVFVCATGTVGRFSSIRLPIR